MGIHNYGECLFLDHKIDEVLMGWVNMEKSNNIEPESKEGMDRG